jgi:hypothetical protein
MQARLRFPGIDERQRRVGLDDFFASRLDRKISFRGGLRLTCFFSEMRAIKMGSVSAKTVCEENIHYTFGPIDPAGEA